MENNLTEEQQARVLAYADKVLPPSEMAETRQWIEGLPAAQWLLGKLDKSALPYTEAMRPMLEIPPPDSITELLKPPVEPAGFGWPKAIAAAVLLGVGVTIGSVFQSYNGNGPASVTQDWIAQVANYQQLYVRPTVDVAGPVDMPALRDLIVDNLGQSLPVPDFASEQVTFRRGQLLQVNGEPLIQLAYLPEAGLPIAFCIMRDANAVNSAVAKGYSHGLNYRSWNHNGLRYVLLGDTSNEKMEALTEIALRRPDQA